MCHDCLETNKNNGIYNISLCSLTFLGLSLYVSACMNELIINFLCEQNNCTLAVIAEGKNIIWTKLIHAVTSEIFCTF